MKLVNLTPHAVNLVDGNDQPVLTIEPSGTIARVTARTIVIGEIKTENVTIPMTATEFGLVENLPEPEKGTIYIVSSLVASRCEHRGDVLIPNESVRNEKGQIVGCKSLGRI